MFGKAGYNEDGIHATAITGPYSFALHQTRLGGPYRSYQHYQYVLAAMFKLGLDGHHFWLEG